MSKEIIVWTDADLDGAASFLVLSWCNPGINFVPKVCTSAKLRECYLLWLQTNKASDYKIFLLDLDTTEIADLIDNSNVTIYDHHQTHIAQAGNYKHARAIVKECKSTAQLIYETHKAKTSLTAAQKMLIALVSDYDCGDNQIKASQDLNNIFWSFTNNKVLEFCKQFNAGFNGFSSQHQAALALHATKTNNIINNLKLYKGNINKSSCIATFCNSCHFEVCQHIFKTYNADVVIMVNVDRETVSFRANKQCDMDVSKLAQRLCEGGGHKQAAGGKLTQTFLKFTQTLEPLT